MIAPLSSRPRGGLMKRLLALPLLLVPLLLLLVFGVPRFTAPSVPETAAAKRSAGPATPAPAADGSLLPTARAEDKKENDELGLAGSVPVDEFNDAVKDKKAGDGKPVRGGMVRLRFPVDPKSLCPVIDNDNSTGT